jgi:ribosomal-protein-alanine N-acetyltransferase
MSDDETMFLLRTDDEVNKYTGIQKPGSIRDIHTFIHKLIANVVNNEALFWVISLKDDPALIGTFCFWNINKETGTGEIGYTLLPAHWGKGYMHEVMQVAMEYGKETMQLKTTEAYTHKDNTASKKLLEKNGFILDPNKKAEEDENLIVYVSNL